MTNLMVPSEILIQLKWKYPRMQILIQSFQEMKMRNFIFPLINQMSNDMNFQKTDVIFTSYFDVYFCTTTKSNTDMRKEKLQEFEQVNFGPDVLCYDSWSTR